MRPRRASRRGCWGACTTSSSSHAATRTGCFRGIRRRLPRATTWARGSRTRRGAPTPRVPAIPSPTRDSSTSAPSASVSHGSSAPRSSRSRSAWASSRCAPYAAAKTNRRPEPAGMTTVAYDTLWLNARLATMTLGGPAYGAIEDGVLAVRDGAIVWVGPRAELPAGTQAARTIDAGGRWITPGLIDPHTHLIFGGERVADFERRVSGESYVAAAGSGSGIAHTVALTRAADEETLFATAARRLRTMIANGTTTVEIK